ncbi:hypothetical protein [Pseudoxanthomonas putridarboris]|uniref:Uncharacterized protein n=1 Tax=Pseudoxanthomonas putridarboris TaxID=752605 RepID=A0ABU9J1X2_9GAMM
MPLDEREIDQVRRRVFHMYMDTIETFRLMTRHADELFGTQGPMVRSALEEWLRDFVDDTGSSGERHPESQVYGASRESLQKAGFYGAQLDLKERQVSEANTTWRERMRNLGRAWRRPFKKWVDVINNFLGSLIPAVGAGEALKELKDCMRDQLPDDE